MTEVSSSPASVVICARSCSNTASIGTSPSPPVASMLARIVRTTSTIASNASAVGVVMDCLPSRSRDSSDSPVCVTCSSRPNARNPLVPLMVWIVRNALASRSRAAGSTSSASRSRSS